MNPTVDPFLKLHLQRHNNIALNFVLGMLSLVKKNLFHWWSILFYLFRTTRARSYIVSWIKKERLNEISYSWVMFCFVRFSLWLHSPGRLPFFLDPYLPTWYTVVFFGTASEPDYKILQSPHLFLSKKQKKGKGVRKISHKHSFNNRQRSRMTHATKEGV